MGAKLVRPLWSDDTTKYCANISINEIEWPKALYNIMPMLGAQGWVTQMSPNHLALINRKFYEKKLPWRVVTVKSNTLLGTISDNGLTPIGKVKI